jgi:hypothetical protein
VFGRCKAGLFEPVDFKVPHAKVRELALENDFWFGALSKASLAERFNLPFDAFRWGSLQYAMLL